MEHRTVVITELNQGAVQALRDCDWHSGMFKAAEAAQRIEALQQAREAADVHKWDVALP
ncbi:MAG: hypothetical protein QOC75_2620 [Pseudonocardiales bacterium]|jgi:hypothetical protein|nr:hypothetical protein [Pseudonocardiales bacterium]